MADDIGLLNSLAIPLSNVHFCLSPLRATFWLCACNPQHTCARKDRTAGTKQTWRPAAEVKNSFCQKVVMQGYVTKHALAY